MKNRGRNTTFASFLLKYRGRNYTNFPETWERGSKWRSICSNLHRVSTPPGLQCFWKVVAWSPNTTHRFWGRPRALPQMVRWDWKYAEIGATKSSPAFRTCCFVPISTFWQTKHSGLEWAACGGLLLGNSGFCFYQSTDIVSDNVLVLFVRHQVISWTNFESSMMPRSTELNMNMYKCINIFEITVTEFSCSGRTVKNPHVLQNEILFSTSYMITLLSDDRIFQLLQENIDSLWPSDAIWHRSGSALAQVMTCCLMAPSHYLNQCWLIIHRNLCHSPKGNVHEGNHENTFKIYKNQSHIPQGTMS